MKVMVVGLTEVKLDSMRAKGKKRTPTTGQTHHPPPHHSPGVLTHLPTPMAQPYRGGEGMELSKEYCPASVGK